MALDATVKGPNSNSYVLQADANTYFADRLNADAFTTAPTGTKDKALVSATRRLEAEEFFGTKTSNAQALKWPRQDVRNQDTGDAYDPDAIPQPIKLATFELALYLLLQGSSDPFQDSGLEAFDNVAVGSLDVTPNKSFKAGMLPAHIARYLRGLSLSAGGVRLMRG